MSYTMKWIHSEYLIQMNFARMCQRKEKIVDGSIHNSDDSRGETLIDQRKVLGFLEDLYLDC